MDTTLFTTWFHHCFVPSVRGFLSSKGLPPRAVLLLDNCTARPMDLVSDCGNIICYPFPPNVTPILQPMDNGIIEAVKRRFRKMLLLHLLQQRLSAEEEGAPGEDLPSILSLVKKVDMKLVCRFIGKAWLQSSPASIAKSFAGCFQHREEPAASNTTDEEDGASNTAAEDVRELCDAMTAGLKVVREGAGREEGGAAGLASIMEGAWGTQKSQ